MSNCERRIISIVIVLFLYRKLGKCGLPRGAGTWDPFWKFSAPNVVGLMVLTIPGSCIGVASRWRWESMQNLGGTLTYRILGIFSSPWALFLAPIDLVINLF